MADKSKLRMNLAAIKKIDPYAKDIVNSSSHVAFYTFNSNLNEWEKTDVEGAFFIYSRNAQPYHSIFINNRLNTTSFVEPITNQLELQSQPPFLLYRNERSRIRGFWFYDSQECDRIGNLINAIVQNFDIQAATADLLKTSELGESNINIFKLLSKAQEEYTISQSSVNNNQTKATYNVLKFFASAKPAAGEVPFFKRVFPNTLSLEQVEKQQLAQPSLGCSTLLSQNEVPYTSLKSHKLTNQEIEVITSFNPSCAYNKSSPFMDFETRNVSKLNSPNPINSLNSILITKDKKKRVELTACEPNNFNMENILQQKEPSKPALMPPTMFDMPSGMSDTIRDTREPLNRSQLVQAFSYLIQNDDEFVHRLHEAYLKTLTEPNQHTYK